MSGLKKDIFISKVLLRFLYIFQQAILCKKNIEKNMIESLLQNFTSKCPKLGVKAKNSFKSALKGPM